jgi:SNF2 family DNA or RNA helicase
MNEEVIFIDLDERDKEDYEIMEKILYFAIEFDISLQHIANMDFFTSTNDSFMRKFAEMINELISKGNKIIAFGTYNEMISLIHSKLKKDFNIQFPIYEISRQSSPEERQKIISYYEDCPGGALLLTTNVLTAGYKVNKTDYLFHLDVPNAISTVMQRNRRICLPVGSDVNNKKVYYLITKDTLQEQKYKKMKEQRKFKDSVVQ